MSRYRSLRLKISRGSVALRVAAEPDARSAGHGESANIARGIFGIWTYKTVETQFISQCLLAVAGVEQGLVCIPRGEKKWRCYFGLASDVLRRCRTPCRFLPSFFTPSDSIIHTIPDFLVLSSYLNSSLSCSPSLEKPTQDDERNLFAHSAPLPCRQYNPTVLHRSPNSAMPCFQPSPPA